MLHNKLYPKELAVKIKVPFSKEKIGWLSSGRPIKRDCVIVFNVKVGNSLKTFNQRFLYRLRPQSSYLEANPTNSNGLKEDK